MYVMYEKLFPQSFKNFSPILQKLFPQSFKNFSFSRHTFFSGSTEDILGKARFPISDVFASLFGNSHPRSRRRSCMGEAVRRRVKRRQFDAGGDQTSCRRSRDAAKNMYTTRRATIGHFLHHSGHGPCDDGPSIRPASSYRVKSSKRVLSSGDYFYFCNRKNKLVGGRIHILWIDYDPKSILKFLVFW